MDCIELVAFVRSCDTVRWLFVSEANGMGILRGSLDSKYNGK